MVYCILFLLILFRIRKLEQAYRRALLEARAEELGLDPYSDEFMDVIAGKAPAPTKDAATGREGATGGVGGGEAVAPSSTPAADDPYARPSADYYAQRRPLDRCA